MSFPKINHACVAANTVIVSFNSCREMHDLCEINVTGISSASLVQPVLVKLLPIHIGKEIPRLRAMIEVILMWTVRKRGCSTVYRHTEIDFVILETKDGIFFGGRQFRSVDEAKKYAESNYL